MNSPLTPESSAAHSLVRRLGLGRGIYLAWHAPLASLRRCVHEGGPYQQWITRRGQSAMMAAARLLPPVRAQNSSAPEVCFLTGRKFWYQTAFCCWSLSGQTGGGISPVFIDDGSFDDELQAECRRVFPHARILFRDEIEAGLDVHLPAARFPALRAQRRTYIHLRKITDAHAGHRSWRIVLDSDMLFFRPPAALLAWLAAPGQPIHMMDVQDAYGYPDATLSELAGRPVPHRINVGICGLRSEALDWEKIEWWCAQLLQRHGTSYYLEQALVALLLADTDALRLPAEDYRLLPDEAECRHPRAVLHHYVADSKRGYFRHAWRLVQPTVPA